MVNKKAAMELSIGTIVIIVLAMSMLILGLVLIRTIFKGSTESIEELNSRVRAEITNLFVEEENMVVKLGEDKVARVRADTENFGIGFGAKTIDGSTVDIKEMKFKLTLDDTARENCLKILKTKKVEELFDQIIGTWLPFDEFEGDTAFAMIQVDIPKGTILCSQKVFIDVKDGEDNVGRRFFTLEIIRKGFF